MKQTEYIEEICEVCKQKKKRRRYVICGVGEFEVWICKKGCDSLNPAISNGGLNAESV